MRGGRVVIGLLVLVAVLVAAYLLLRKPAWDISAASTNLAVVELDETQLASRGISLTRMGQLVLPTGRIVVADPLTQPDRPALAREVEPGRYEVTLFRALDRIALAALRVSDAPVARWELALLPGQSVGDLKAGHYYGFPVDTGLGSFMDASALALIERRGQQARDTVGQHANYYDHVLHAEIGDGEVLMHRPLPDEDTNVAIFGSGWGDGFYPAIWGVSADGTPVVLVLDFHVLDKGKTPVP